MSDISTGGQDVRVTLNEAIRAVEEFRKLDAEMQMQTALIFLLIARNEGMTINDLMNLTGLTSSSCSRNVSALSETHRKGRPGHNLVSAKVDVNDRRVRHLFLTPKGRSVLQSVLERFGG